MLEIFFTFILSVIEVWMSPIPGDNAAGESELAREGRRWWRKVVLWTAAFVALLVLAGGAALVWFAGPG